MLWLQVVCIIFATFICSYAVEYKDLLDTSKPETFINLSTEDFANIDEFEEIDVKQVIREEMQKNGQQMGPETENFLNNPIQGSGKFEGDIELPANTAAFSADTNYSNVAYNAIRNTRQLWPNGVIPYVVSSQIGSYGRRLIASSIADYQRYTCMKVVPRTNQRDYVTVRAAGGCYSMIGRTGGAQTISLPPACLHKHTIIHEFMHAAGFYHEQSRYDRDTYINIYWQNILPGMQSQFSMQSSSVITHLGTRYDLNSVMHYPAGAFARYGGLITIAAKNGGSVGNSRGFSKNDIVKINKLYGCGDKVTEEVITETGDCRDTGDATDCKYWANDGECSKNKAYMADSCKKSCGLCGGGGGSCRDDAAYSGSCGYWSKGGYCTSNAEFMKEKCRKSCGLCGTVRPDGCTDDATQAQHCGYWAKNGYCFSNQEFMHSMCKKSCGVCGIKKTTKKPGLTTTSPGTSVKPATTPKTDGDSVNKTCTYWPGTRGTYSGLDNKPSESKEECCKMCQNRSDCKAMTFNAGRCWMHTIEYKDNIEEDCEDCFFAEM